MQKVTTGPTARDPYQAVTVLMLVATVVAAYVGVAVGNTLSNVVILDAALALGVAAGFIMLVLASRVQVPSWARALAATRARRRKAGTSDEVEDRSAAADSVEAVNSVLTRSAGTSTEGTSKEGTSTEVTRTEGTRSKLTSANAIEKERTSSEAATGEEARATLPSGTAPPSTRLWKSLPDFMDAQRHLDRWFRTVGVLGAVRAAVSVAGLYYVYQMVVQQVYAIVLSPTIALETAGCCLLAAIFAALAARYFANSTSERFPESGALARGARIVAWLVLLAGVSLAPEWAGYAGVILALHIFELFVISAVCVGLLLTVLPTLRMHAASALDIAPLRFFGQRTNIFGSIVDSAEHGLGIDLRSTWALTVVKRGTEPLLIGLLIMWWLSSSFTVVGIQESGLVERMGVPVAGEPMPAGLHVHWPWPIDKVYRLPVRTVQSIGIGHEGEEAPGPENVLWAVEHAPNEFTLLLGNGRDLITIDAALDYRIRDARAWRYGSSNPEAALKALAYRSVMRNTVNRTLSEALSENVAVVTQRMLIMTQRDADSLGLGVEILGFTIGGMHPPVAVASSYEAVVSAQIGRVTQVVNAQTYRNQRLPAAQDSVLMRTNTARADNAQNLARAAGEAWSFRALEAQYRAAPAEYFFRRRLETLETGLSGRPFTLIDSRFMRDGGELWVTP